MHNRSVVELPLSSLVIGKGQVRTREVGKDIDELAASIKKVGLLEPITVCPSPDQEGMFEILTGQRRFLAHQALNKESILAVLIDEHVDATTAKVISITENLVRTGLNTRDLIDACTELYKKYGSIREVSDETGLPYAKVQQFVKFDRLRPEMKDLVQSGELELKVALKAQDATMATGEYDPEMAVELAKEMSGMTDAQRQKTTQAIQENPTTDVETAVGLARAAEKEIRLEVRIGPREAESLSTFAKDEGTDRTDAAAQLLREGLMTKGYLEEDDE